MNIQLQKKVSLKIFIPIYTLLSIVGGLCIKGSTLYELPNGDSMQSWHMYIIMLFVNVVVVGVLSILAKERSNINCFRKKIEKIKESVINNKKTYIILGIGVIVITLLSYIAEFVWEYMRDAQYFNIYSMCTFWIGIFVLFITVLFRKKLLKHAHTYFFVVVMLIGSLQVLCVPHVAGLSWDDEVHYGKAAHLSWGGNGYISYADWKIIDHYDDFIYGKKELSKEGRENWKNEINSFDAENHTLFETTLYPLATHQVAYIPSAIILSMGRAIGLDFTTNFVLGKWINLLLYALLIRYAIKILPKGKLVMTAIALILTNVFLASSYSYDWWVTSFVMLGYALFLRELQLKRKISTKLFVGIMAIMIIGLMPKAIYFPLIFPMCILKRDRYENQKLARVLAWIAMFILIATFILPLFASGAEVSDNRGGETVSSGSQIGFVLQNPLSYVKILGVFMLKYLAFERSYEYLVHFAYLGIGQIYIPAILAVFGSAIADNSCIEVNKENKLLKYGVFVAVMGSLMLAATALYISFTEVGYYTIIGCQRRYILPVIFPLVVFLCGMNVKTTEETKINTLSISTIIMVVLYLWGLFSMGIMNY